MANYLYFAEADVEESQDAIMVRSDNFLGIDPVSGGLRLHFKDIEGNEGWIHKSLLKGDRFAITNQPYETMAQIYRKPQGEVIGSIGKKNIVKINSCLTKWCKIEYGKYKGWMNKKNLWGVYKKEKINVPFYQQLINFYWSII